MTMSSGLFQTRFRLMTDADALASPDDESADHRDTESVSLATSVSLLERARNDDAEAWNRLVELYAPLVYHWCRRWGLQPAVAEDVGQDVFLSVAIGLARFRKERPEDTFRGWLRVITRRRVADYLRKAEPEPDAVGGELRPLVNVRISDPEKTELSWEARFLFERAVQMIRARFSERDWEAFYRTAVRGEPARTVAGELSMSVNSVYLARSRIASFVREEFAGILEE
jgi:RNA polymerase sigma-70 factor (ECF subfamily)